MKILLLEDEKVLNSSVTTYLESLGHSVDDFFDGAEALEAIENQYDLLVMDINVPNMDGFGVVEKLHEKQIFTPVIFISALVDLSDILRGYSLGAIDYLKKPFHLEELGIKIESITIKNRGVTNHIRLSQNYSYIKNSNQLFFNGEIVDLTKKQSEILKTLVLNIGMVVDFELFRMNVWNDEFVDNPTIRAEISRFRKTLKEDFICNIRGLGYRVDKFHHKF